MKKIIVCLLLTIFLLPVIRPEELREEPVYIHDIPNVLFVGPLVCEFAINGDINMIRIIEPYIYNGRVYFTGIAFPASTGVLRSNFEFNLDFYEDSPRVKAVYRGPVTDPIAEEHLENGLFVAGYAEPGSIIINHVFFDLESIDRWTDTVKLASD